MQQQQSIKQNAAKLSSARTLFDVGCSSKQVDNTEKIAELKLAAHIACHSSIATVDHLGEIVKKHFRQGHFTPQNKMFSIDQESSQSSCS